MSERGLLTLKELVDRAYHYIAEAHRVIPVGKDPSGNGTFNPIAVDTDGNIQTEISAGAITANITNTVSTANSSSAPLLAGAVFTGTGEDVSNYSEVTVFVAGDFIAGGGTTEIQFSTDNLNWDYTEAHTNNLLGIIAKVYNHKVIAKFFRVVYTNGLVNQAGFRLQSILHAVPAGDKEVQEGDELSTTSYLGKPLAFYSSSGGWINVKDSTGSRLPIVISENLADLNSDGLNASGGNVWLQVKSALYGYDGTGNDWDRIRTASADNLTTGVLAAGNMVFDGTNWDRARSASGDNLAATGMPACGNMIFDGSTWDRWTGAITGTVAVSGVTLTSLTATETPEVSVTTSNTSLKASNASRKKLRIQNHGTGFVRVSESATAIATSPIRLVPQVGEYWIEPTAAGGIYTGAVAAISESGTNLVGVTEYT